MMKKVIVIGAGISGLSAGIYALKNGFSCEIYEKNINAGGECITWKRKGYLIDGSISWLTGVKPGTAINDVWLETGAFRNEDITFSDVFSVINHKGRRLYWYRDTDKLAAHLKELSPEDSEVIDELIAIINDLSSFEVPAKKPMDIMNSAERRDHIKHMMQLFKALNKVSSLTTEEYTERFSSELIRKAILSFSFKDNLVQGVLVTLGALAGCHAGWPVGGSQRITDNMKACFLSLGGVLNCGKAAAEITVNDGRADGIILEDGTAVSGDYIVPTCDLDITLHKLLKSRYSDPVLDSFYTSEGFRTSSIAQVAFGVECDLSAYPSKMIYAVNKREIAGETIESVLFTHYCSEKDFAPEGCSIVKTGLTVYNYNKWCGLSREEYLRKKEEIKEAYLDYLYHFFPETKGKVVMCDVTTPQTYERYCGAYHGAYMGFMLTPATSKMYHSGIIKGLRGLYAAGQWFSVMGGLPDALVSGKSAIQRICANEGISFKGVQ